MPSASRLPLNTIMLGVLAPAAQTGQGPVTGADIRPARRWTTPGLHRRSAGTLATLVASATILSACTDGPETADQLDVHLAACDVQPEATLMATVVVSNLTDHALHQAVTVRFVDSTGSPYDQALLSFELPAHHSATRSAASVSANLPINRQGCRLR